MLSRSRYHLGDAAHLGAQPFGGAQHGGGMTAGDLRVTDRVQCVFDGMSARICTYFGNPEAFDDI